jgi:hypothetical protein
VVTRWTPRRSTGQLSAVFTSAPVDAVRGRYPDYLALARLLANEDVP